jgi:hypothetical protein
MHGVYYNNAFEDSFKRTIYLFIKVELIFLTKKTDLLIIRILDDWHITL